MCFVIFYFLRILLALRNLKNFIESDLQPVILYICRLILETSLVQAVLLTDERSHCEQPYAVTSISMK